MEKESYTTYPTTKNIIGYIINVHDALNFDIDLFLPPELDIRYNHVIIT